MSSPVTCPLAPSRTPLMTIAPRRRRIDVQPPAAKVSPRRSAWWMPDTAVLDTEAAGRHDVDAAGREQNAFVADERRHSCQARVDLALVESLLTSVMAAAVATRYRFRAIQHALRSIRQVVADPDESSTIVARKRQPFAWSGRWIPPHRSRVPAPASAASASPPRRLNCPPARSCRRSGRSPLPQLGALTAVMFVANGGHLGRVGVMAVLCRCRRRRWARHRIHRASRLCVVPAVPAWPARCDIRS